MFFPMLCDSGVRWSDIDKASLHDPFFCLQIPAPIPRGTLRGESCLLANTSGRQARDDALVNQVFYLRDFVS